MAISEGALLFGDPNPCISDRETNETAWRLERYQKELAKLARAKNIPADWTSRINIGLSTKSTTC